MPLNNEIFSFLARSKSFCQELLRVLLSDKDLVVVDNQPQKNLPNAYFKDAVVDLLCKLSDGRIVNVEIQLYKEENHPKRIFFYASMIRQSFTKKGIDYKSFNDIIIIYLTKKDIFKKGSTVYNVDMSIVSDQEERVSNWDCGLKIYYINTEGITNKNINEYLKILTDNMTYINKYKETSEAKKEIYTKGESKMSVQWLEEIVEEEKEKAMKVGKEEGRKQGLKEGMIKILVSQFNDKKISAQEGADYLGVTVDEFLRLVNE